jgi:hypothetical protein
MAWHSPKVPFASYVSFVLKIKEIVDVTMNCPNLILPVLLNTASSRPVLSVVKKMNTTITFVLKLLGLTLYKCIVIIWVLCQSVTLADM